jgi:catechol 2,3-dioxygenase-like lactoylglutathione lyase family enzyme
MSRDDVFKPMNLDHIVLRVHDLERAARFYEDVIGCKVERRVEKIGLAQMRVGTSMIDLVSVGGHLGREGGAGPGKEGRNVDHLCVKIDRFDENALIKFLRSKGVEPFDIAKRFGADGYGPVIYVRDPDGNMVELKGPSEPVPANVDTTTTRQPPPPDQMQ